MKAIYIKRIDGNFDFVAAFDIEKINTVIGMGAREYLQNLVDALEEEKEEVLIYTDGSVTDFPDALALLDREMLGIAP